MKSIPLTRGQFALVDDADYEQLSKFKWYARKTLNSWYAARSSYPRNKRCGIIYMHSEIAGFANVDHRDRNGLNNQRSNLRRATRSDQMANSKKRSVSIYRGVSKTRSRWFARIHRNGKATFLGVFDTPEKAARAYDEAAKKTHGQFANLNFV